LNNYWVKEAMQREFEKYLERSKNRNMTYQNLWDTAKAVLRGTLIVTNAYIRNGKEGRKEDCQFTT
jgi:hypothetical protein